MIKESTTLGTSGRSKAQSSMTYGGNSHIKPRSDRFIEYFLLQTNSILFSYLFHINYFTHIKSYKMDKVKATVSNFLSRDGKHETTVQETANPAIENERVLRTGTGKCPKGS